MPEPQSGHPIRVVHVISQLIGGRGHLVAHAAATWTALGVRPVIVTPGEVFPKLQTMLEQAGAQVVRPPKPIGAPAARLAWIGAQLAAEPGDVIHLHDRANMAVHPGLARRHHRGPIVATLHGCGKPPPFMLRIRTALARHWAQKRLGVVFVAVSSDVQAVEKRNFGIVCRCINNWTTPDLFPPPDPETRAARRRDLGIPDDRPVVVTVANCAPVKRHPLILDALGRLKARRPEFLFLHAGRERHDGERRQAAALGLESQVRFLGRVQDVAGLLQAADLMIMASSTEGLSLACLEALSTGLPAVLTPSPGLRCMKGAFHGLTFAPPAPDALALALDDALNGLPAFRAAGLGRANHEAVRRGFSPEVGAAAYTALYRERLAAAAGTIGSPAP